MDCQSCSSTKPSSATTCRQCKAARLLNETLGGVWQSNTYELKGASYYCPPLRCSVLTTGHSLLIQPTNRALLQSIIMKSFAILGILFWLAINTAAAKAIPTSFSGGWAAGRAHHVLLEFESGSELIGRSLYRTRQLSPGTSES